MSYILDALRKSEQQRLQGESPLLVTTQTSFNVNKQPTFLLYGLVAAIIVCAGILIVWLRPWHQDETEAVKESTALAQNEATPPQIAPMPQSMPQSLPPEPEKAKKPVPVLPAQKSIPTMKPAPKADSMKHDMPAPAKEPIPAKIPAPAKIKVEANKSPTTADQPKIPEQKVSESKVPEQKQEQKADEAATPTTEKAIPPSPESNVNRSASDDAAPPHKIIAMTELPLAIQQEIPAMSISGHAYSTIAKERIVGINDHLLQEGEYLAPGLKLEQITEDGLVFSYKKYLFRHSL